MSVKHSIKETVAPPFGLIQQGFEINTDAALVNPDWEVFAEQHDQRYGLAISHLKSQVKGKSYDNGVMNLRVGRRGFYMQSRRFPAAFFGDTVAPELHLIDEEEARAITWEAAALYRSGEAQSLTCIFSEIDPPDVFFGYRVAGDERYELGSLRTALPLHLRVMIDTSEPTEVLGDGRGVVVYQRTTNGEHVLLKAPGRRQPYLGFLDFSD